MLNKSKIVFITPNPSVNKAPRKNGFLLDENLCTSRDIQKAIMNNSTCCNSIFISWLFISYITYIPQKKKKTIWNKIKTHFSLCNKHVGAKLLHRNAHNRRRPKVYKTAINQSINQSQDPTKHSPPLPYPRIRAMAHHHPPPTGISM